MRRAEIVVYLNIAIANRMKEIKRTSLDEFYQEAAVFRGKEAEALLPPDIHREIGHFNVFDVAETMAEVKRTAKMPYSRRTYYKISLIRGKNRAEYADKVIEIDRNALLFATPKVPYHWVPEDPRQAGSFCIFTDTFLSRHIGGMLLDELPIFRPGGYPVFALTDPQAEEVAVTFDKMKTEIASDYAYKYDLLRNYVIELIHYGQKMQPAAALYRSSSASARVTSLFLELLERQFPIESTRQRLSLRTANDYADRLAVHVNHLNKVLKETIGKTTTELLNERLVQEAKILLRQTDWSISEVAWCLGFEEIAHFSNFFKKQTSLSPSAFRV